jgi:3'(2'), 5'-bisphosphate nucleotidase
MAENNEGCSNPAMISEQIRTETMLAILGEAGRRILAIYAESDFGVTLKDDLSPLTRADVCSHEYLSEELRRNWSFPVLSEESPVSYAERKDWPAFWLVDPLDGTKDFIARNGEFTINVALVSGHDPVWGAVAVPALHVIYYAASGCGAFRVDERGCERIHYHSGQGPLRCADSRFHSSAETKEFCRRYGITDVRKFGSAIKLCKLAEGEVDVYPRLAPTKEWDTAAGHCIAREGGCKVIDVVTKREPVYNKENLVNNSFIACAPQLDFLD